MFGTIVRFCSGDIRNMPTYHPDWIDKKILVHYKHYPSVADVPDLVDQQTMNRVGPNIFF